MLNPCQDVTRHFPCLSRAYGIDPPQTDGASQATDAEVAAADERIKVAEEAAAAVAAAKKAAAAEAAEAAKAAKALAEVRKVRTP